MVLGLDKVLVSPCCVGCIFKSSKNSKIYNTFFLHLFSHVLDKMSKYFFKLFSTVSVVNWMTGLISAIT